MIWPHRDGVLMKTALIHGSAAHKISPVRQHFGEDNMSLILIILLLVLIFGGGGGYYAHRSYGGYGSGGILGLVVIVLLLVWLFGGFGPGYVH
jgi:hypothetical protein